MREIKETCTNPIPKLACRLFGHKWLADGFLATGQPKPDYIFQDLPPLFRCQRCPATHQHGGLVFEKGDKLEITNATFYNNNPEGKQA